MTGVMRARAITALVALPPLVFIVGFGPLWLFSTLVFVATALALREYYLLVVPGSTQWRFAGMLLGLATAWVVTFTGPSWTTEPLLAGAFIGCFCWTLLSKGKTESRRLGWFLLGLVYLGGFLSHFVLLAELPRGREWMFFVLLTVMAADTGGYFIGTLFGKRKLAPRLSPGKTVEGTAGLIATGTLAGTLAARLWLPSLSGVEAAFLALWLSVLGQLGDLFESWIKRRWGVKDSGALFPGHGGILDRVDSLIFPAVFTTLYVKGFHS
jgi:phosphatidate cytidylyltransferase